MPLPVGFSTRVWSRWTARSNTSLVAAWAALSFRALALATIVLFLCGLNEYFAAAPESVFVPHIEDTVTSLWGTR